MNFAVFTTAVFVFLANWIVPIDCDASQKCNDGNRCGAYSWFWTYPQHPELANDNLKDTYFECAFSQEGEQGLLEIDLRFRQMITNVNTMALYPATASDLENAGIRVGDVPGCDNAQCAVANVGTEISSVGNPCNKAEQYVCCSTIGMDGTQPMRISEVVVN